MSAGVDEDVDLSDLDMLDETKFHVFCPGCQPQINTQTPPVRATAVCGKDSLYYGNRCIPRSTVCDGCVEVVDRARANDRRCSKCGLGPVA